MSDITNKCVTARRGQAVHVEGQVALRKTGRSAGRKLSGLLPWLCLLSGLARSNYWPVSQT